ncbi:MAG TPA: twin-arginine translocase subunit TatC [Acidimicrobiales bacterium]|nr:twin-arginine translocase subunit TatC [Acidimicrobiales bacterium]
MALADNSGEAFSLSSPRIETGPSEEELGKMTLFEHLGELRHRLLIAFAAIAAGTIVAWFFYDDAIRFMLHPYHDFLLHHRAKDISNGNLITTGPLEGFTTRLKVSAYGGFALASPVVFWQVWRFVTPGLYKNEKRYIVPFVASAVLLFAGGVATAILVFPKALTWLIDVSGSGIVPLFSPTRYFTLYVAMCMVFGGVFIYPLLVVFLQIVGVVPSATWRRWRRPAIVVICLVAAVVTPSSDPFSFLAMAVPMLLFYEAAIVVGRLLKK